MRRFGALALLAALGAAFVVSVAAAQQPVIPQWYNPATGAKVTVQPGAQTGFPTVEQDKDRDFPLIANVTDGQSLTPGQTYTQTLGTSTMQYTRLSLMLTWTCAVADTDSVKIAVRVYGMTNSTGGNWYLWTPMATLTSLDSCETTGQVAADSIGTGRCLRPTSFWVGSKVTSKVCLNCTITRVAAQVQDGPLTDAATNRVRIRKIPGSIIRYGSANGVVLSLTDNAGAPLISPYIRIEVTNASNQTTLSNIRADIWPRVQ